MNSTTNLAIEDGHADAVLLRRLMDRSAFLAHDIKNMLSIISMNSARIQRHSGEPTKIEHLTFVNRDLLDRADAIARLIMDLSDETGDSETTICLNRFFEQRLPHLRSAAGASIDLNFTSRATDIYVQTSLNRLVEICFELVLNARKALSCGGTIDVLLDMEPTFPVEVASVRELALGEHDGFAVIRFIDNGMGMACDTCEKVLERGYTTDRRGTGLGLPFIRAFARDLGGDLLVDSQLSEGTTITLRLPAFAANYA